MTWLDIALAVGALCLAGMAGSGWLLVADALREHRYRKVRAEENRRTLAEFEQQKRETSEAEWLAVLAACEEPIWARLTYERHLADLERWNNGGAA